MLLWATGAAAAFAPMLAAYASIRRVRRSAKPFPDRDLCNVLSRSLGIRHPVDVLETHAGSMPMTFGILRCAVFIPSDAGWTDDRRRVVLLHELAHVRRGDVGAHLLARTALALYWWNPMAWTAWREFLKERERATDDLVLNAGTRASEYANHLLEIARTMQSAPALGSAAVAMARRSQLEGRLLAILDSGINRRTPGRAGALVAALAAVAMVAPLAAVRAQDASAQGVPTDVDAAIRAANSQRNYEILDNAATAAEQLRKYDTAKQFLQAALAIRGEVSGKQSAEYGEGLLKLGDLETMQGRVSQSSDDFYTRAAQILGDRPEASRALMFLGVSAIKNKEFPQAIEYFQHAQRIDPAHAGSALMWMGVARMREKNNEEAEALFKSAVSIEDPKSSDAAVNMYVYANFLRTQDRPDEAKELETRAAAAAKANAPPAPALSRGVNRIGAGTAAPKLLQKVEPEYSELARVAMLSGTVHVSVEIGPDGFARNPRVLLPLGLGLDERAIAAISQWKFQPGTKDGQPVAVLAHIDVNFHLL